MRWIGTLPPGLGWVVRGAQITWQGAGGGRAMAAVVGVVWQEDENGACTGWKREEGGIHPRKWIAFNSTNIQALPQKHLPMVLSNTPTSCHRLLLLTVTMLIIPNDLEAAIFFSPPVLSQAGPLAFSLTDQKITPARGAGVCGNVWQTPDDSLSPREEKRFSNTRLDQTRRKHQETSCAGRIY